MSAQQRCKSVVTAFFSCEASETAAQMAEQTTSHTGSGEEKSHLKQPPSFEGDSKMHSWFHSFEHFMTVKHVPKHEWPSSAKTYFSLGAWEQWHHHEGKCPDGKCNHKESTWEEFKAKCDHVFAHKK